MERLLAYLNSIYPLSEQLSEQLPQLVRTRQFKKKEHLLRPGEICRNIYYIETGLIRCYYLREGVELTSFFMGSNDFCVEVQSFYRQVAAVKYLQALEATTVYYISYDQLEAIYKDSLPFNIIGRKLTVEYFISWDQKMDNLVMATASERYKWLQDQFPNLEQRVPAKIIASYLGMIPETLSRMKQQSRLP